MVNSNRINIRNMIWIYIYIMGISIQMVYFTGGLKKNTGHGYSGIGEHTYTFTVKDVIDY